MNPLSPSDLYVPDKLASPAPVVVAAHYCTGSASAFFGGLSGLVSGADKYGYIMIFPETVSANSKCWDVNSEATLKHNGGGDSAGIVSMVQYAKAHYNVDSNRVYVMGTSSGAMMTNVLLGAYPDVFTAGSAWSGVPFACFAGPSWWNSDCANGKVSKTAQQWGDLVRAAYPGCSGRRPRMQIWHGDTDTTLNFNNFGEAIKEWTNVAGLNETPTSTELNTPQQGYTRTRYKDSRGRVRVEAVRASGIGHNLGVMSQEIIRFFALDQSAPDPDQSGCGGEDAGIPDSGGAMPAAAGEMAARPIATPVLRRTRVIQMGVPRAAMPRGRRMLRATAAAQMPAESTSTAVPPTAMGLAAKTHRTRRAAPSRAAARSPAALGHRAGWRRSCCTWLAGRLGAAHGEVLPRRGNPGGGRDRDLRHGVQVEAYLKGS